jgi:hypothetical protein
VELEAALTACSIALSPLKAKSRMRDLAAGGAAPLGGSRDCEHAMGITDVTRLETAVWSLFRCLSRCELGEKYPFGDYEASATKWYPDSRNSPWNWHVLHVQTLKGVQARDLGHGSRRPVRAIRGRTEVHVTEVPSSPRPNRHSAPQCSPTTH